MHCTNCGQEYEGKFCPNCGAPAADAAPKEEERAAGSPERPLSKKEQKARKKAEKKAAKAKRPFFKKGWFWVLVVIVILCCVIGSSLDSESTPVGMALITRELQLTEEQTAKMTDLFEQCGIGEIMTFKESQPGDDESSYFIHDAGTSAYGGAGIVVWINNETKEVTSIYFHDKTIYADGQVQAKVTDYYLPKEDQDLYLNMAQALVDQVLNYPDSAKYQPITGWAFGKEDGKVIVQSSVEAKNAFGEEGSYDFQVVFRDQAPVSLIFDGQEYMQ